ncbi:hypothetical protein CO180_00270 [candidate division WWE3 bacterium CG_4_9_14_3_um_filter_41_6]|uniref:Type II toxin-antitoxin system HicA family toxin n=1 Tax=candidate division WWE3 bacterium CG_4_10_14_0_2_um_filter_41_14 TaxID=1975072 RepID=A0A2M7TL71_UNCKA|nr:MAG: hypothetical protein COY32_01145 [candidate division WWE3 bacterium CG_4_10_14_0_2_um_filter_41_14]PJA39627.1 MAG: hypothetical protein CO180_00270 [candidate division WWE3 bacterium CG_4_9_14_3_um_filter_41_6]
MPRITPISRKRYEQFLRFIGCTLKRQKGDHLIYVRSDLSRPVVFPYDKEIPAFIQRTNLRTLGITTDAYYKLLKNL